MFYSPMNLNAYKCHCNDRIVDNIGLPSDNVICGTLLVIKNESVLTYLILFHCVIIGKKL